MRFLEEADKEEYKNFLCNHERCNFQQSLEWGNVKEAWIKQVILSTDDNEKIIGSLCVWIRKIPLFGNIMYCARGPVCDIHNEDVLRDLTEGANELAKKYNAFVLRIEPDIIKDDEEFRKIVTKIGYKIKDDAKNFKDEIQPRFVFKLDIKGKTYDEILKNCHQKTRYNIKLASKKGVIIKEGEREDLKDFHKIMIETGERDNFIIRSLSYFQKMYDELVPQGHMKLLMAYYEDKPIAGIIPIIYGKTVWYLYGASSNNYRNLMPNYLLQWTMIKQAIDMQADTYDFRGVSGVVDENHPQYGLYRFKKGFGAEFTEFIGEVYIAYKPIKYMLYKFSEKSFRTLRKIKKKLMRK
ncbi:MAG: peptidoglycan bridge formation glycyltransferase FemA/FemB family protein [Clostridia bacterium]|nr:peptidoglycan bridge formation glycyltransferase FemA/FemB family protein [Clostridia bacterium]